jgi:hypothetical protein
MIDTLFTATSHIEATLERRRQVSGYHLACDQRDLVGSPAHRPVLLIVLAGDAIFAHVFPLLVEIIFTTVTTVHQLIS